MCFTRLIRFTAGKPPVVPTDSSMPNSDLRTLIVELLVLLLHVPKCLRRESQDNEDVRQCEMPHCKAMKDVMKHVTTCQVGRCPVPLCCLAGQIISYWDLCSLPDCAVCLSIRQIEKIRNNQSVVQNQQPHNQTDSSHFDMQEAFGALHIQPTTGVVQHCLAPDFDIGHSLPYIPASVVPDSLGGLNAAFEGNHASGAPAAVVGSNVNSVEMEM